VDGITSLLDQNMLQQVAGIDGEPRYRMLETIREYAIAKLTQSGEAAIIRDRHLHFFLTLAETAEPLREDRPAEVCAARVRTLTSAPGLRYQSATNEGGTR